MLIDVKNLFKIYHEGEESEVRALDGVSLSVDRGELVQYSVVQITVVLLKLLLN